MKKLKETNRGFGVISFSDTHGEECSLQESSSAEEPSIWLGINRVTPRILNINEGWVDYPIPEAVCNYGRMHLNQLQVSELLPYLQHFADYGDLRVNESLETSNTNKYERMWNQLKKDVETKMAFHKSGIMQSMHESIEGENNCKEFLESMDRLEKTGGDTAANNIVLDSIPELSSVEVGNHTAVVENPIGNIVQSFLDKRKQFKEE